MTLTPSEKPHNRFSTIVGKFRVSTWIGIGLSVLFALIGLAGGGFWSMILTVALICLGTCVYGLAFRRHTWLRLPRKRSWAAVAAVAALIAVGGSSLAYGSIHPTAKQKSIVVAASSSLSPAKKALASPQPTPSPMATVGDFGKTSVLDTENALTEAGLRFTVISPDGQTSADFAGWTVRSTIPAVGSSLPRGASVTINVDPPVVAPVASAAPVPIAVPAPAPAVPAPVTDSHAGATAMCKDGTLSYSAHRQGTCSHHGGVSVWY